MRTASSSQWSRSSSCLANSTWLRPTTTRSSGGANERVGRHVGVVVSTKATGDARKARDGGIGRADPRGPRGDDRGDPSGNPVGDSGERAVQEATRSAVSVQATNLYTLPTTKKQPCASTVVGRRGLQGSKHGFSDLWLRAGSRIRAARPAVSSAVRPTYRRSAAGARGSEATDKPVCCNAKLSSRLVTRAFAIGHESSDTAVGAPSLVQNRAAPRQRQRFQAQRGRNPGRTGECVQHLRDRSE